jgi:hypothetical protein
MHRSLRSLKDLMRFFQRGLLPFQVDKLKRLADATAPISRNNSPPPRGCVSLQAVHSLKSEMGRVGPGVGQEVLVQF